jgi:hypothetical protein
MFSNETPCYFPIDLHEEGIFSTFYPNLKEDSVRNRYSPQYSNIILDNLEDLAENTLYNKSQLQDIASHFNLTESIFNPKNWVISPNETIKIISQRNFSDSSLDFQTNRRALVRIGNENKLEYIDLYSNSVGIIWNTSSTIKAMANIERNLSYCGELNRYTLKINNNGNANISDLTIKIPNIGIISNLGDFHYTGNELKVNLAYLNSSTSILEFNFDFYTPNSLIIKPAIIRWKEKGAEKVIYSNEILLHAPISFESNATHPFLYQIDIEYSIEITEKKFLIMNCTVINTGQTKLSTINLYPLYSNTEFELLNNSDILIIEGLAPFHSESIILEFKVLYPNAILSPIFWIAGKDDFLYTIHSDKPKILGNPSLMVTKLLSRDSGWTGQKLNVQLTIRNTGNVPLQEIYVDDFYGYPFTSFSLYSGVLQKSIPFLDIGEIYFINYTLVIKERGLYTFKPVKVQYLYTTLIRINSTEMKFQAKSSVNLIISLSLSGLLIVSGIFYITWVKKQNENKNKNHIGGVL